MKLQHIQETLAGLKKQIYKYFYTTERQWQKFTQKINNYENEGIWVFLIACGYALGEQKGLNILTKILTGSEQEQPANHKIWFEAEPIPTRKGNEEKNTHMDLSLGSIAKRFGTQSGIKLDTSNPSWVCFCEAKYNRDISCCVTHDPNRNQLIRVIDNAICFQDNGIYAERVYVTVITPKAYEHRRPLLESKLKEYQGKLSVIVDIERCQLSKRNSDDWLYPEDLAKRARVLSLRRVFFEELINELPDSEVSNQIKELWSNLLKVHGY